MPLYTYKPTEKMNSCLFQGKNS